MRENFDYVTMETYSADMAESSARAAGIISVVKRENDELKRMVWLLVQASGGRVKIPYHILTSYSEKTAELTVTHMMDDRSLVLTSELRDFAGVH